jgi:NAD(P)-dependent dehydrogenase (short-subunit alcohol dehydrogenase family)
MTNKPLTDRIIVITGATGGLGRVAALTLAGAGATLVLIARKVPRLENLYDEILKSGGPQPAIYPLDLAGANEADYAEMAQRIRESLGPVHGIFHAAAELGALKPFQEVDGATWQRLIHVNLSAPVFLTQSLLSSLKETAEGTVVFVDDSATGEGKAFWGAYGVAKAGLRSFAKMLHAEMEGFGVRATCFTPGPIRSPIRLRAYPGESLDQLKSAELCKDGILNLFAPKPHNPQTS